MLMNNSGVIMKIENLKMKVINSLIKRSYRRIVERVNYVSK